MRVRARRRGAARDLPGLCYAQTPINSTYIHDPTKLDGVNVWLLQYLAAAGNMNISFETVFLTDTQYYHTNRTAQMVYLFETLGYDCLFSSTILRAERMAYANFLVPNEQFGLSVVTPLTAAQDYPVRTMLFAWTDPFSWQIWVTVASSLVFGAIVMFVFEGSDDSDDYGPHELALPLRIARGAYKAVLNFTSGAAGALRHPRLRKSATPLTARPCVRVAQWAASRPTRPPARCSTPPFRSPCCCSKPRTPPTWRRTSRSRRRPSRR